MLQYRIIYMEVKSLLLFMLHLFVEYSTEQLINKESQSGCRRRNEQALPLYC